MYHYIKQNNMQPTNQTHYTPSLTGRMRGGSSRRGSFLFLLLFLLLPLSLFAKSKPEMKRVYMFGFSASFTDSLACMTTVQQLDSAWVDPSHGFLMDRALYSLQLQYYVESSRGLSNNTCTVFFARSQRKAERLFNKIRKRYQNDEGVKLCELSDNEFRFKAENYIENAPVQVNDE